MTNRTAIGGAVLLLGLVAGGRGALADSMDPSFVGAWTTSQADCKKLFERNGGVLAFRPPVDRFAQAAIIEPQQILLPSGACRVQSVSHEKGAIKIGADCHDSISFTTQTIHIRVAPGGGIVYSPTGDSTLDTTFVRCPL